MKTRRDAPVSRSPTSISPQRGSSSSTALSRTTTGTTSCRHRPSSRRSISAGGSRKSETRNTRERRAGRRSAASNRPAVPEPVGAALRRRRRTSSSMPRLRARGMPISSRSRASQPNSAKLSPLRIAESASSAQRSATRWLTASPKRIEAGKIDQRRHRDRAARRELAHMQFAGRVAQRSAQVDAARVGLAQQADMAAELAFCTVATTGMGAGENALRPPAQAVGNRLEREFLAHGAGTRSNTAAIRSLTIRSRRIS